MAAKFCRNCWPRIPSVWRLFLEEKSPNFWPRFKCVSYDLFPNPCLNILNPQNWWVTGRCFCLGTFWRHKVFHLKPLGGKNPSIFPSSKKNIFFLPKTAQFDWHKKLGVFCLMGFRKPGFHGSQADRRSWKEHPNHTTSLIPFYELGPQKPDLSRVK